MDAFHPTSGWTNPDVIGIDVGITLPSAENLRSGAVWRWFMRNPEIPKAMRAVGLDVVGQAAPRVIHIVQHVLYPVLRLPAWPSEDRRTRLVFIVRDLGEAEVRETLDAALAAG